MPKQIKQDRIEEVKKIEEILESHSIWNIGTPEGRKILAGKLHHEGLGLFPQPLERKRAEFKTAFPPEEELDAQPLEKPECEFTKGRPFTLLHQRKSQPLTDKELGWKANDLLINCSTHFDNDQLEAILDVFDQILALLPDIEEARKEGFDDGVSKTTIAMDSTIDAQLGEARKQLSAEIRIELGSKAFNKGKKQERERMYDWLTVNWTSVDGVMATYNRADIEAYLKQALSGKGGK